MEDKKDISVAPLYIDGDLIPFSAYQAIFHKITKKVDKIKKIFQGGYEVKVADVINLHERLYQAIAQYSVVGCSEEIVHVLNKEGTRTFNDIRTFKISDMSSRLYTKSIAYTLEFLIILPSHIEEARDIAQRYKVSIVVDRDEIDDDDSRIPFFLRGYIGAPTISLSLEYADYMVAQALVSVVNAWTESLPKEKESGFLIFVKKMERKVRVFLPLFVKSSPFLFSSVIIYLYKYEIYKTISLVMFCFFVSIFSEAIFDFIIDKLFYTVMLLGPRMMISLTLGDRDFLIKIKEKKKSFKKILAFIFGGIIFSIAINVFSTWIYPKLFN